MGKTNYIKYSLLILVITSIVGCRSILVNNTILHTGGTNPIAIGVVGLQKGKILNAGFQVTTLPDYKKELRVGVTAVDFTKMTYNAYRKASKNNIQNLNYVDSIKTKPKFVKLQLLDQVTAISELEEDHNIEPLQYLKSEKSARMVTSVSMALPGHIVEEITKAEAVFLINDTYKQYGLSLVRDGKSYQKIDFARATVFGYKLSRFCWGEDDRRKIVLKDISNESSSCPKNTYRDAVKAKEKLNYFKL